MDSKRNNLKKHQFYLAVFILTAMIPNLLLIVIGEDSVVASYLKKFVFALLSFSIIILPLSFLKPKYFSWLIILLLPLIIFETAVISHYKVPSSEETVAAIFLTNYSEITELITGNILSALWVFALFLVLLFFSYNLKSDFKLKTKLRRNILIFTLSSFSILYARNFIAATKLNNGYIETLGVANYALKVQLNKIFPVDIFLKLNEVHTGIQKKKNYQQGISGFKFNAVKKDSLKQQEIYVLVLGETARKHNFSLYNYARQTTPNLDTISSIFNFKNVASAANITSLSIPFILTRATPKTPHLKFNEPAIINTYKEAGFKTYWISNQSIGVGSVFGFYASLADVYKNTSVSLDAANYDNAILPELQQVLNDTSSTKKFIIIHTLGSHFRYNYRYPEMFNKFRPSMSRGLSIGNSIDLSKKQELINSYDNSILYTDHVLANFISLLKKQHAISFLYYISDHGENLYDDQEKILHAYLEPSKYEIEIPLIVWTSNQYNSTYPTKTNNLYKHNNVKISSINTFHTLLNLSNITYPTERLIKSFASNKFDSLQKRYFYKIDKTVLNID